MLLLKLAMKCLIPSRFLMTKTAIKTRITTATIILIRLNIFFISFYVNNLLSISFFNSPPD